MNVYEWSVIKLNGVSNMLFIIQEDLEETTLTPLDNSYNTQNTEDGDGRDGYDDEKENTHWIVKIIIYDWIVYLIPQEYMFDYIICNFDWLLKVKTGLVIPSHAVM